jgi:mannosyl-oligosaccharide alpha-1,2-mannosidase
MSRSNCILYVAVPGTLVLEWAKLTEYTGNKTFLELAEKAMRRVGTNVSVATPSVVCFSLT